jgi:sulfur-oxidizing protein SoxZ
MSTLSQPRIRIPRTAKPGEVIEIRTLIEHRQETGIRQDGSAAPERDILTRLIARRDGETIFSAELRNGTSANPYHVFFVRMERTAEFSFTWTDLKGRAITATARVVVT